MDLSQIPKGRKKAKETTFQNKDMTEVLQQSDKKQVMRKEWTFLHVSLKSQRLMS